MCKYYYTDIYRGVVGYPIQVSEHDITVVNTEWDSMYKYFSAIYSHN